MSADPRTPPAGHNSKERQAIIVKCVQEIVALESKRDQISEQIRDIKQTRIKGELNMKIGDFNAALRLYRLEGDDREAFMETLRETFLALGLGEQLDFLATHDVAAKPLDLKAVYATGKKAGLAGKDLESNPHDDDTEAHENWAAGWRKGQDEMATQQFNSDAVAAS